MQIVDASLPALRAALAALRTHRAGLLVVARRDRIARDVVLAVQFERDAARAGARLVSAAGEGNGDSPADAFMRVVLDGAAQYEHALIRARTRAALAVKRAHGERIGAVPYGFALGADGRCLVTHEREQADCRSGRSPHGSPPKDTPAVRGDPSSRPKSRACSLEPLAHRGTRTCVLGHVPRKQ
jgi:hypothetical protein